MRRIGLIVMSFFMLTLFVPYAQAADPIDLGNVTCYHPNPVLIGGVYSNVNVSISSGDITITWELYFKFDAMADGSTNYFHAPLTFETSGTMGSTGEIDQSNWSIKDNGNIIYSGVIDEFPSLGEFTYEEPACDICLPTWIKGEGTLGFKHDQLGDFQIDMAFIMGESGLLNPTKFIITTDSNGTLIGSSDYILPRIVLKGEEEVYHILGEDYIDAGAEIHEVRTRYGSAWQSSITFDEDPSNNVDVNTIGDYTFAYIAVGEDAAGAAIEGDSARAERIVHVTDRPIVVSTVPDGTSPGKIDFSANISGTFSKDMQKNTVESAISMVIVNADATETIVTGDPEYENKMVVFDPGKDLYFDTTYKVTIEDSAVSLEGVSLPSDYSWTFHTPVQTRVVKNIPESGATKVDTDTLITVTFSANMNTDSVKNAFTLRDDSNKDLQVEGKVECTATQATITPAKPLSSNTKYTATINSNAMDSDGYPLKEMTWSFTTVDPEDNNTTASTGDENQGDGDGGGGGGGDGGDGSGGGCFIGILHL